jgi:Mn-dependent DtxR family transcriptional regulator
MEEDLASNVGFIMGNKQRERIVQVLGSKGRMPAEKIAKFEHIPLPSAKRILQELAARKIVEEKEGSWGLTNDGVTIEREMKKRA